MNRAKIENAAFGVSDALTAMDWHILMAVKTGDASYLMCVRARLAKALAIADAALSGAAVEGEDA